MFNLAPKTAASREQGLKRAWDKRDVSTELEGSKFSPQLGKSLLPAQVRVSTQIKIMDPARSSLANHERIGLGAQIIPTCVEMGFH